MIKFSEEMGSTEIKFSENGSTAKIRTASEEQISIYNKLCESHPNKCKLVRKENAIRHYEIPKECIEFKSAN